MIPSTGLPRISLAVTPKTSAGIIPGTAKRKEKLRSAQLEAGPENRALLAGAEPHNNVLLEPGNLLLEPVGEQEAVPHLAGQTGTCVLGLPRELREEGTLRQLVRPVGRAHEPPRDLFIPSEFLELAQKLLSGNSQHRSSYRGTGTESSSPSVHSAPFPR